MQQFHDPIFIANAVIAMLEDFSQFSAKENWRNARSRGTDVMII
jgi:hypothetical protein